MMSRAVTLSPEAFPELALSGVHGSETLWRGSAFVLR